MARSDAKAENQHWVPQLLLRNFASLKRGKEHQLWVFDKSDARSFRTSTKNVANERNFYAAELGEDLILSIEQGLTGIETAAAEPLRKLLAGRRLDALTAEDMAHIALFAAVQFLRTKTFREKHRDFDEKLSAWLRQWGSDEAENWKPLKSENDRKLFQIHFFDESSEIGATLTEKTWLLFEPEPPGTFWTSDNPVMMCNDLDRGLVGVKARGVQIYLPLSPTLMLGMWCPTYSEQVLHSILRNEDAIGVLRDEWCNSPEYEPTVDDLIWKHAHGAMRMIHRQRAEAIQSGTPVRCAATELRFFQELALRWAERQVYFVSDDSETAREILATRPRLKAPPRMQFGF